MNLVEIHPELFHFHIDQNHICNKRMLKIKTRRYYNFAFILLFLTRIVINRNNDPFLGLEGGRCIQV